MILSDQQAKPTQLCRFGPTYEYMPKGLLCLGPLRQRRQHSALTRRPAHHQKPGTCRAIPHSATVRCIVTLLLIAEPR